MTASGDIGASSLSFDAPVAGAEVHKHAVEEVLITDSAAVGSAAFVCAAQLPRSHRTYAPAGARHHDPLLLLELLRQATIVVGHRHLGVPRNRQFLIREAELALHDLDACRRTHAPAHATVDASVNDVRRLDGVVGGYELQGRLSIDGAVAASGAGACLCLPPEDYRAVRGQAHLSTSEALTVPLEPCRADPADVGRREDDEVMVTAIERPAGGVALADVIVDPSHASFFDHPLDHVPATLLVEAARQVAHAAARAGRGAVAVGCRVRFIVFAELDSPVTCRAELASVRGGLPSEPVTVDVKVEQDGDGVAELSFDLGRADA